MGRILRLHASFISTRKPSYNGLPMPLGQALNRVRGADSSNINTAAFRKAKTSELVFRRRNDRSFKRLSVSSGWCNLG